MMTITAQLNYVKVNHPEVYQEIERELQADKVDMSIVNRLLELIEPGYYRSMYFIACVILLYSPATIKARSTVAVGVVGVIASSLNVGNTAISKRIPSVRQYYNNVSWFRDNVDRIVKEVRG